MTVIRIVGLVGGAPSPFDGRYLVEYDPERLGVDPAGQPMLAHVLTSEHRSEALELAGVPEAHALWTRVAEREPVRPDGRPNRPLTAFSVELLA